MRRTIDAVAQSIEAAAREVHVQEWEFARALAEINRKQENLQRGERLFHGLYKYELQEAFDPYTGDEVLPALYAWGFVVPVDPSGEVFRVGCCAWTHNYSDPDAD